MSNKGKYGIGLDMGTSSIGFAGINMYNRILKLKGKDLYGVRLFNEGKTAAKTREYRNSRRRYSRRKLRLKRLKAFFDEPIAKIDPNFFARLKYSSKSINDKHEHGCSSKIFNNISNHRYYKNFPTIYHLRDALMNKDIKFDIRLIYLAIHHIIKYRGNFLMKGNSKDFSISKVHWEDELHNINTLIAKLHPDLTIKFDLNNIDDIKDIFLDNDASNKNKQSDVIDLLSKGNKENVIKIIRSVINGIIGFKVHFYTLFNIDSNDIDKKQWSFTIDQWDDKVEELSSTLNDIPEAFDIVNIIKRLNSIVQLNGIVPEGETLSQSMVEIYNEHHKQLKVLKQYTEEHPKLKGDIKNLYGRYINNDKHKGENLYQDHSKKKYSFYKQLKDIIKNDDGVVASNIRRSIENDDYLLKQRTKNNSVIPYQLQQKELDAIIDNQGRFYPWLKEKGTKHKLDELLNFRIPYYVGPLTTSNHSKFAWMTRKEDGEITPWNFNQKVDRIQSANDFIKRMKMTDTFLLGEDVLPKNSLLYQKYNVLNELNKIKINGRILSVAQKQRIYNECFMENSTVKSQNIINNLRSYGELSSDEEPKIEGLSNNKFFNSSLKTYLDLKHIFNSDLDAILNNYRKRQLIEDIISWSTTFKDRKIFNDKINMIKSNWISEKQKKQLSYLNYRGWGRLSKTLLCNLYDKNHKSIMDNLWNSNANFMQIVNRSDFKKQINVFNNGHMSKERNDDDVINEMFTSPQNKRAMHQAMLVLDDIVKANGNRDPDYIYIETAKSKQSSKRTNSRVETLNDNKKSMDTDVKKQFEDIKKSKKQYNDRLLLYFQQNGRDIYNPSKKLNINGLNNYYTDIDHILPRYLIKDDSLDNRVLTSKNINENIKGTDFAININNSDAIKYWKTLLDDKLITKGKYNRLMMTPNQFNYQSNHFIARQLVETRQVIKLVTELIHSKYKNTKIINVKAGLSSYFRRTFDLPKNRDINDYHHAFDAYLAAIIGNYLQSKNSSWRKYFSYDEYNKNKPSFNRLNNKNHLNFIYDMKNNEKIYSNDTKKIIWNRKQDLDYIHKVYDWKKILLTRRLFTEHAGMFSDNIAPASNSKSLIPIKKHMPTNVYGGYTSIRKAYYMIVKVYRKEPELVLLSMYRLIDSKLKQAKNTKESNNILNNYLKRRINQRNVRGMKVIFPKIYYEQLFESHDNNGKPYRYRIHGDWRSDKQLYMPLYMQRLLTHNPTNNNLDKIFDYICSQMKNYFPMFIKQCDKVLNNKDKFYILSNKDKKDVIIKLLQGLHSNGQRSDLKEINAGSNFGRITFRDKGSKFQMIPDYIIYQSPSGLFERKLPLGIYNNENK